MTTNDTTYNGWTNYATWRVNLEILDGYRESWIDEHINDDPENIDPAELAGYLSETVDDVLTQYGAIQDGFALDYARSFVSDADFYEIAETYIRDLAERLAYEAR